MILNFLQTLFYTNPILIHGNLHIIKHVLRAENRKYNILLKRQYLLDTCAYDDGLLIERTDGLVH